MEQGQDYQRDLLAERGWIDRWGFLTFAFGGAAGILIAKVAGATAIPVAAGAAIAMVAYAFVIQTTGTGRLRGDQAGDNCYYLGLIYTLVSLAFAIFFFDPATTATTVVQGFGIALATTIMGLVLRVFFNQSRVDLVETEDTARIELAEAAGRLKAELQAITVSMGDFGRETRQALQELRSEVIAALSEVQQEASQAISTTSTSASEAIGRISEEATHAITDSAKETIARARNMATATDKVVASLQRHAESMAGVGEASAVMGASISALQVAADKTQENLGQLVTSAGQLAAVQADLLETGKGLRSSVTDVSQHVRDFDASLTSRLDEIKATPADMAQRTAEMLARAAALIEERFKAIADGQQALVDELVRLTEGGVTTLGNHNAALERELDRSRDNVAKVHASLVEMTGTLVNRVGTIAA